MSASMYPPLSQRAIAALMELEAFARYCLETELPDTPRQACEVSIAEASLLHSIDQRSPVRQEVSPCALP